MVIEKIPNGLVSFIPALIILLMTASIGQGQNVDFAHDVLPLLTDRCASCHSNGVYKGGLSLENRDLLVNSGAVKVGAAAKSELIERISSDEEDFRMPPEGEALTKAEIEKLSKWIDEGMDWPAELSLKKSTFKRPLALRKIELPESKLTHPIDRILEGYFAEHSVSPPAEITDWQFYRRAKLDLLGQIPTASELADFSQRGELNKRELLVSELLERNQDYADHWMSFWNDLLRNDYVGTGYIDGGRKQITNWLYVSLLENKPYDQFVNELIGPSPESDGFGKGIKWRGRVNASQIQPLQFSQNVSQVFLGINMKCASCHDSFIDEWKLEDAYGLAAIVSDKPLEMHRCDVPTGKTATSKFVFPELGSVDQAKPKQQRLEQLSLLMTSKKNGRFSRTIVNRLWHRMMGRGLVHPVDMMATEAWSETLLDFLANDLVANGYDLKRTVRLIATSKIYRSAAITDANPDSNEPYVFRGVIPKRVTAEQFVDAIWQVTKTAPKKINAKIELFAVEKDKKNKAEKKDQVEDERVFEKMQPNIRASLVISDSLMRSLGRPNREQVVTTRPAELSTLQALDLSNGKVLNNCLKRGAAYWIKQKTNNGWSDDQLIENVFVASLSRSPTELEKKSLKLDEQRIQESVADLLWIVTMLPEFQFVK